MKLAVVGVGGAGSRIANRILDVEHSSGRNLSGGNTLLVNSSPPTFDATEHVPEERRLVIGDVYPGIDGRGTEGDPDLGAEVAVEERNEIVRAFDLVEFHRVDGVLVAAGLAGGTGGGAGAVVIDQLKAICDEPVYAIGVLPSRAAGARRALNAARSLQSFVARADNVIVFDNDAWLDAGDRRAGVGRTDDAPVDGEHPVDGSAGDGEAEIANVALAERVVTLFSAGESGGDAPPETWLDPSDIIRTLGVGGISSIGYASTDVPTPGRLRSLLGAWNVRIPWTPDVAADDEPTDAAKINRLVRRAARSKLTLPCEVSSADRALVTLSGPSRALSRKGFESGRYWLETEADVVDVMAGDEPLDRSSTLAAVVLFSNVTEVPRIEAMKAQAVEAGPTSTADGMRFGRRSRP